MQFTREQINTSLKRFVERRDAVLHDDESTFFPQLKRLWSYLLNDPVAQEILNSLPQVDGFEVAQWWHDFHSPESHNNPRIVFPDSEDGEFYVQYKVVESAINNEHNVLTFGFSFGKRKTDESITMFRNLIMRSFLESLGDRISKVVNLVSPQERAMQAVPLNRLPKDNEVKIFLSHKSADKALVQRYYDVLKELGYSPWLDNPNMPAGSNLERALLQGFQESCAVIFFITENFKDENYLATEVDYAVRQKRKKGDKFAIVTLVFALGVQVPDLLDPYVYKYVNHELQGLHEIIRALPIELGPVRWKESILE